MNATIVPEAGTKSAREQGPRVASIDIFRGLTMAVMIFVNQLSSVPGLPWWTYHAHEEENLMTYVDMVFPFFLFIVGMSLPISVAQRLKRNPSVPRLWLHVLHRVAGLVVLGLILANAEKADASRMHVSGNVWALLALLCAAAYLNVYPASRRFPWYGNLIRGIGLGGVVVLLAVFRRSTHAGHAAWIDPSYPEILGLIGFSYLASAVLYIPTRRWRWSPLLWFAALLALCVLSTANIIPIPDGMPIYLWPFDNGAMSSIVMAGVMTSQLFLPVDRLPAPKAAMIRAIGIAALCLLGGWICIPLGISKIRATPTWSLWCIAAAILVFTLLYWICDIRKSTRWALLVKAAGSNTLLTYLLPDFWYFLSSVAGITWLDTRFTLGWEGVAKTVVFTIVMLCLAGLLSRAKLRLQL